MSRSCLNENKRQLTGTSIASFLGLTANPGTQDETKRIPGELSRAHAHHLNKAMIPWFVEKTFARPADKADPRVDLVNAKLAGLPPVTVINAEIDPLRSDGDMIVQALKKANVKVTHQVYRGVTHEFFGTAAAVKDAKLAQNYAGGQLNKALNPN